MDPCIVTAALVGAEVTREHTPHLPMTPEEIACSAIECWEAGASVVHLHARNDDGSPTPDLDRYARCIAIIRQHTDLVVQVTTGGALGFTEEERLAPIGLDVEMASLTTGTANFADDVFLNPTPMVERFARAMKERGVRPELEIFDVGQMALALRLLEEGLVEAPAHFQFVMGTPGGMPATADVLLHLVGQVPAGSHWAVCAVGRHQLPMNALCLVLGGHVRVGFEDNVYYAYRRPAVSNAEFVQRIARLADELQRPLATAAQARELLGLTSKAAG
jgi:3-keto-5-aminohexanoate cleavage enzyme